MRRLVCALILAGVLDAQEFRATLQGTVADPLGAVIPAAEVSLRNVNTGVERADTTDETGHYRFSFLPPGAYSLRVRAAGFRTSVLEGIALSLDANIRLDVNMTLGPAAYSVTVPGEPGMVQPETSSLGTVVRKDIADSVPLKGHSSLYLFNLAVGVIGILYSEDTRPNNTVQNVLYSASGSPPATGDVAVDGVSNTVNVNRGANLSAWVPAVDAIAEFKLQTGTLPAEYGRSGGSIMSIVIKSGTNSFHGSLYNYLRNAALDANLFFPRGAGQQLAPFNVNMFGASVEGPIRRNRSFFFFNFEGAREGNGLSHTSNVPTLAMRRGDFSGCPPLYDPYSVHRVDGAPLRVPFPSNVIPYSAQDPVGRRILSYYPEPNTPGANQPWVQNWVFSAKWPRDYNNSVLKLDQHTPRHQRFLRLNYGTARLILAHQFDGIATPGRNVIRRPNSGVAVNDTVTLDARTIIDLRAGYTGGRERNRPWSDGFNPASLGLPASYSRMVQSPAFPTITVTNFQSLAGSPLVEQPGHTWTIQPSVSVERTRHLFKTGGEIRVVRGNFFRNSAPSGSFSFIPNGTGGPRADTPSPSTGVAAASLLLGYGTGGIEFNQGVSIQNIYYAGYFQDDWRVSGRLTLNLGVRYEYETPRTERFNRTTRGFAYDTPSPLRVPGLDLRGGLLYAGHPRGLYDPDRNNLAPRLGFAFTINRETVVRGGAALSYIPVVGSVQPTGYSVMTPWVSTLDGITPHDRLSDPFPDGLLDAPGNSLGMMTLVGEAVTFVDPGDRTPTFYAWQLSVQRELPSRSMLEMGYVGSRAIRIIGGPVDYATVVAEQVNQLHPSYLAMGTALLEPVPNPFRGVFTTGPLSGDTVQRQQLLRPYPQFTSVSRQSPAFGNSVYHSLQVRFEKRMAHGVTALAAYTVSKNISDIANAQDAYNRRAERAVSEFDAPQRLTVSAAWELPWLRGWQLSTFSTFQSGFPVAFQVGRPNVFAAGANQRPSVNGDPMAGVEGSITSRLARYFNTGAFVQPADFTFGNIGPRLASVRCPGMNNVNVRVAKDFKIGEFLAVGLRASSFNVLNHPVFSAPNTTLGGSSFGRIFNQANLSRQMEFALKLVF
ncbi:MAG: TonB-dependent receptor domain-containing protein [Bryobacteraceae bacterium]